MPDATLSPDVLADGVPPPLPDHVPSAKRGPKTPEGKARSAMNALKHGLRARTFGILPGEEQSEWALHLAELRASYGPVDAAEEKLVAAIAAAMWHEIRADRTLAEVMVAIPPLAEGRPHGGDLQEPRHALSLNTALRYMTAAGMASQRAQRAFLAHRKAKRDGLILPEPAAVPDAANQNRTNDFLPGREEAAAPAAAECTNEMPPSAPPPGRTPRSEPLTALRARLDRLLDGAGPRTAQEWDLVAAIRAARLPGGVPYRGPIDRDLLEQALHGLGFDAAGLAWLAAFRPPAAADPPQSRLAATG
ncbi:MAG: hypothetical protein ACJ8H8_04365 [Geminicoccaceae bacterium]